MGLPQTYSDLQNARKQSFAGTARVNSSMYEMEALLGIQIPGSVPVQEKFGFFCHTSLVLSNDIDETGIKIERVADR